MVKPRRANPRVLTYATSQPTPYGFAPLIAESHQGRQLKLRAPFYIPSGGSTDIYSQASVLDLPIRIELKEVILWKLKVERESTRWKKVLPPKTYPPSKIGLMT